LIDIAQPLEVAIGLLVVVAILRYLERGKKPGLGVRLITAGAALMLIAVGFQFFVQTLQTAGESVLAQQVEKAGIYIGYTLAGVTSVLGALIIALKKVLRGE